MGTTLADGISFVAASAGTGTFVVATARSSFLTLSQAQSAGEIADGDTVSYLALDSVTNPTQREWGHGTYSLAGNSIARTTVLGTVNVGTPGVGSPLNFSIAPIVFLTALAEDLSGVGNLVGPVYNSNYNYQTPTTGSTIALNNSDYQVILNPATGLASLTITLPPSPTDGQIIEFVTSMNISGLMVAPNAGQSVDNPPIILAPGGGFSVNYRASNTTWYCQSSAFYIPANGNLQWYVSPTGSDSNPGTLASPFATPQKAANIASFYDWQNLYQPTVNFTAGTIGNPNDITTVSGPFRNLQFAFKFNGAGASSTTVNSNFQIQFVGTSWGNMTMGSNQSCLNPLGNSGAGIVLGDMTFNNLSNPYTLPFFTEGDLTSIFVGAHTITIVNTTLGNWLFFGGPGSFTMQGSTCVLPAGGITAGTAFIEVHGSGYQVQLSSVTYVNAGGVAIPSLIAETGPSISTPNASILDIPGTYAGSVVDGTVSFTIGSESGLYAQQISGVPTISNVPYNCWGVFKDTSGGGVYVACNDAGTLKKVQLT